MNEAIYANRNKKISEEEYSKAEQKAKELLSPIYIAEQGVEVPEGYTWIDNLRNGKCRVFYNEHLSDEQVNQYHLKYEWEI